MTNQQKMNVSNITIRRNKLLLKIFKDCDFPVRLLGDPQKPVLIYDEAIKLSAYALNFDLFILQSPDGPLIQKLKIKQNHNYTRAYLYNFLRQGEHQAIIKIRLMHTNVCLAGYHLADPTDTESRHPYFARYNTKIYFDLKYVHELIFDLQAHDYDVTPYIPAQDQDQQTHLLKIIYPVNN